MTEIEHRHLQLKSALLDCSGTNNSTSQQTCRLGYTATMIGKRNQVWWSMIENRMEVYIFKDRPIQMLMQVYKHPRYKLTPINPLLLLLPHFFGSRCAHPWPVLADTRDCSLASSPRAVCCSERHLGSILYKYIHSLGLLFKKQWGAGAAFWHKG